MTESAPRTIILETSSRAGRLALAQGDTVLDVRQLDEARRHARDLVPALRDLLAAQHWQPRDVQLVVVSKGPGSYTGLRVGIMSAKTFAYATGCPLVAIETMHAIALQSPAEAQAVDVFVDAQQDRVYFQRFIRTGGEEVFTSKTELRIIPFVDWLNDEEKSAWVSGPGLYDKEERLPDTVQVVETSLWIPQPSSLLVLGLERNRKGALDDIWSLEPLYLRPSAAEEQWQARSERDRE